MLRYELCLELHNWVFDARPGQVLYLSLGDEGLVPLHDPLPLLPFSFSPPPPLGNPSFICIVGFPLAVCNDDKAFLNSNYRDYTK